MTTERPAEVDALVDVCMSRVSSGPEGLAFDDAAIAAIHEVFEPLTKGALIEAAVQELLLLAYFFEQRKSSPAAATALLDIVHTALPRLHARGRDLEKIVNSDDSQRRMKALGLSPTALPPMGGPAPGSSNLLAVRAQQGKKKKP